MFSCVLGWNGVTSDKWEGDGCTPARSFHSAKYFIEKIEVTGLKTTLPTHPITKSDGWCDDPEHSLYNMLVRLPLRPLTKNYGVKSHTMTS